MRSIAGLGMLTELANYQTQQTFNSVTTDLLKKFQEWNSNHPADDEEMKMLRQLAFASAAGKLSIN